MIDQQTENVTGALALALADAVVMNAEGLAPEAGPAAATLTLLAHEPGVTIERVRRTMHLSHPGAVRLVDRLAAHGLVERRPSVEDRRAVALHLTVEGAACAARILKARQTQLASALSVLSPEERETFGRLAERVLRAFVRDEDHAFETCRFCNDEACPDCPVAAEFEARAAHALAR